MVGGGAPRHTISITAGGTTHAANQSALMPTVMDTPDSAAVAASATRTRDPGADENPEVH
jgi:hypothetical protein